MARPSYDTGQVRPGIVHIGVGGFHRAHQAMYLDRAISGAELLQAIARTNRTAGQGKRFGIVVDYFGVFQDLEKALNFDESIREEALIDWEALKATVPGEVRRCMELFRGIVIEDTRECLLAARRVLRDPDAALNFRHNFKSLERLWEALSPDPCLYEHRHTYRWLCGIYLDFLRQQRGDKATYDKNVKGFIDTAFADMPRIPLFQPYVNIAMQKNVTGYQYWFHRRLDYRAFAKG